jgi:hypothetical protein
MCGLTMYMFHVHAGSIGSGAWVSLYQVDGGSSSGSSTADVLGRHVPTTSELSLIRDLRDQLKCAQ